MGDWGKEGNGGEGRMGDGKGTPRMKILATAQPGSGDSMTELCRP